MERLDPRDGLELDRDAERLVALDAPEADEAPVVAPLDALEGDETSPPLEADEVREAPAERPPVGAVVGVEAAPEGEPLPDELEELPVLPAPVEAPSFGVAVDEPAPSADWEVEVPGGMDMPLDPVPFEPLLLRVGADVLDAVDEPAPDPVPLRVADEVPVAVEFDEVVLALWGVLSDPASLAAGAVEGAGDDSPDEAP